MSGLILHDIYPYGLTGFGRWLLSNGHKLPPHQRDNIVIVVILINASLIIME